MSKLTFDRREELSLQIKEIKDNLDIDIDELFRVKKEIISLEIELKELYLRLEAYKGKIKQDEKYYLKLLEEQENDY